MEKLKIKTIPIDHTVVGKCMNMCPQSEITLREKEGLLHILELTLGPRKNSNDYRQKIVKSFSRSAVGKKMLDPNNLRPPKVLLETVFYLLNDVIINDKVTWDITYDFIMDRLRAVRQDMVIQAVPLAESICILEPIVRFHAYAAYRLCNQPINVFDPHINKTHLQECLKRLLSLYDEYDRLFIHCDDYRKSYSTSRINITRPQFEALYLVLNLGNTTALMRSLSLPKEMRRGIVQLAINLSLSYCHNNFVRVCRLIRELPALLQGVAAAMHLSEIRKRSLQIMSVAYNSKNLGFPLEVLKDLFLYEEIEEARNECAYYDLKCNHGETRFIKTDFDSSKRPMQPTHLQFIDEAFDTKEISETILNG